MASCSQRSSMTVGSSGWRTNGRWACRTRAKYPVAMARLLQRAAGRRRAIGVGPARSGRRVRRLGARPASRLLAAAQAVLAGPAQPPSLAPPSCRSLAPPRRRSLAPPSRRSLAPRHRHSLAPPSGARWRPRATHWLAPRQALLAGPAQAQLAGAQPEALAGAAQAQLAAGPAPALAGPQAQLAGAAAARRRCRRLLPLVDPLVISRQAAVVQLRNTSQRDSTWCSAWAPMPRMTTCQGPHTMCGAPAGAKHAGRCRRSSRGSVAGSSTG